jgi:hypothetical protein
MALYDLDKPIGEMVMSPDTLKNFGQKSIVDVEYGREQVPLLYKPIYRTIEDANFTENVDVRGFNGANVMFLRHLELEAVRLGTYTVEENVTVPIVTWAAGFEWTEDTVEYNKTWEIAEINRALGEAYNALLNHLHFSPILTCQYDAKNKTAAKGTGSYLEKLRATIRQGLIDAAADKSGKGQKSRKPDILLANSANEMDITEALQRMQIGGTILPALAGVRTVIFYDGWTTKVGEKAVDYAGVPADKLYLIEGQRFFRELIKHDLRIDLTGGDIRRLIAEGKIARARRGVVASPQLAVQEVTLPS